jgi:hypothetical protein
MTDDEKRAQAYALDEALKASVGLAHLGADAEARRDGPKAGYRLWPSSAGVRLRLRGDAGAIGPVGSAAATAEAPLSVVATIDKPMANP